MGAVSDVFREETAPSLQVWCSVLNGTNRRSASEERRQRRSSLPRQEGDPLVEGFVSEEKDFESDLLWDRETDGGRSWRTGLVLPWERVSRRAAEFWME